jgi:putative aldouronate transport system substrate-binding protein
VYSFDMIKRQPWNDPGTWEAIVKEKLNLDVTMHWLPSSGFGDKLQLLIVSDDLPEIFFNFRYDMNKIDKLGAAGRFYALDEFFPVMPNIRKLLEDVPELLPWLAAPDGHIYHLSKWGSYAPYGIAGATHLVRHDIFESYNIEQKWDTYDDFYATLKALKQAEPKYYPWGTRGFPRIIQAMQFRFGTGWGGGWSGLYYDDISDSWKFCTNDPGFKELITFLTKAYAEGILHPEVPTMNSNQFMEHWVDATYRGLALNSGDTFTWESSYLYGENPSNLGKDVRWINPPVSSVPGSRSLYQKGMIDCWSTDVGHVITKKAERPEVLARWLDYMYSEEGQFFHS